MRINFYSTCISNFDNNFRKNLSRSFGITALIFLLTGALGFSQTTSFTSAGSFTYTAGAGVLSVKVECWGAGGAGGGATGNSGAVGGGGGGGAYATSIVNVTPGSTYTITVGSGGTAVSAANGGAGGSSSFNSTTVVAVGGSGGVRGVTGSLALGSAGAGGAAASCTPTTGAFSGGNGSAASGSSASGAGGGGAGSTGNGGNASTTTAGTGTSVGGGNGASGVTTTGTAGSVGNTAGGGGSGAVSSGTALAGGNGASGMVTVTVWSVSLTTPGATTWTAPPGANAAVVECWGGGGGGGGTFSFSGAAGGGGGGGAYVRTVTPVTAGNTYTVTVGAGGSGNSNANGSVGGSSWFNTASTVMAVGGAGGVRGVTGSLTLGAGGAGGAAASCIPPAGAFSGGAGANASGGFASGAGGGGAGSNGAGGPATTTTGGTGTPVDGGNGANGVTTGGSNGTNGSNFGGAGSGATSIGSTQSGGAGAGGEVRITASSNITYIWTGNNNTSFDFQVAANWNPNRTSPATSDILVFAGDIPAYNAGQLLTVTNVPTQSIGALQLNNTNYAPNVQLVGISGNTLTIGSATINQIVSGGHLDIGTNLNIITGVGSTFNNSGIYSASGGGTTTVNGLFNFNGAGQTSPAGITVSTTGELKFSGSGSPVLTAPSISGILTVAGTVTGITGSSPTYSATSTLQYTSGSVTTGAEIPSAGTVHDLIISSSGIVTLGGNATVNGSTNGLKWTAGTLNIAGNTLTIAGVTTGGSSTKTLTGTSASTLNFSSSLNGSIGTVFISGTAPQLGTLQMNLSGTSASATLGNSGAGVSVANNITLNSGILFVANQTILTYMGSAANLGTGSATSFISLANNQTTCGFALNSGPSATLTAGPYIIPIGAATSSPTVNGYRPVTLNFSTPPANASIRLSFFSHDGTTTVSSTNVPTSGNNRAGYLLNLFTNSSFFATLSSVSMSYADADFNAGAPTIGSVVVAEWNSSQGNYFGYQTGNSSSGSLRTITNTSVSVATGGTGNTFVVGLPALNIIKQGNFAWTGNAGTSVWENPANWSGPTGAYPGLNNGDIATVSSTSSLFPVITATSGIIKLYALNVSNAGSTVTLAANSNLILYGATNTCITLSSSGIVVADPTSTIEYAGAFARSCTPFGCTCDSRSQIVTLGFTYGNLLLSNSANSANSTCKTINGTLNVAGNFTVSGTTFLSITAGTTTVSGSVSVDAIGGLTGSGSGNVIMNGGAGVTFNCNGGSFGAPLTINGAVAVSGNSTIGSTLTINSGVALSINNGITLTLNAGSPSSLVNNGTIQSTSSDGGTLVIIHTNFTISLPAGAGSTGTFSSTAGNRLILSIQEQANYGFSTAIASNVIVSNLIIGGASNSFSGLSINSGQTLTLAGPLNNYGSSLGISGPGTFQILSTVNIPAGSGSGGIFNSNLNLTVGDGSTSNTVTATATVNVNNVLVNSGTSLIASAAVTAGGTTTVNSGAIISVANGITYSEATNLVCHGIIQDLTSGGTFSLTSFGVSSIDGGSSGTHGQINVGTFRISTTGANRTINSTAFLDFASTTLVFCNFQNVVVTNNGTIKFNGTAFGASPGNNAFLTAGSQVFNNNGTTTIISTLYIGDFGFSNTVNNSGTITVGDVSIYINGIFNNNNGGIVHVIGANGISSLACQCSQVWNNNAGSYVDDAGPFFEGSNLGTLVATGAGNTVEYTGTGSQVVYQTNYFHLKFTGSGRGGNITLQSGTTGVAGNLTTSATFSSGGYINTGNTINFNGSTAQSSSTASPFTFNNFQFSNTGGGVNLATNATVNGTLSFSTAGTVNTGSNTLVYASIGNTITGANSSRYVNGNLQGVYPTTGGTQTFKYEIGSSSAYAPATLAITGVSGTVNVTGSTLTGAEPNENNPVANASGIDQSRKCANYWTLIQNGGTFTNYNATFDYSSTSNTGSPAFYSISKFDAPSTWTNPASTVAGNTVTASGLTNFSEFEVGNHNCTAPGLSSSVTNVSCNGGSNGSITLTVTGGNSPFTYSWSNGASTQNLSGLTAGTYSVTVTSSGGCASSITGINVTQPAVLTVTAGNSSPVCQASNVNLTSTPSGGTAPFNFAWVGPNSFNSPGQNTVVNSPSNGNTYTVFVSDAHGCTASATTTVTVNQCATILNLNLYVEGYYIGSGLMNPSLFNENVAGATNTEADSIVVELRDTTSPGTVVESATIILNTNNTAQASFSPARTGNPYWIAIKHRSAIQTWSAAPVGFTQITSYDFTSSQASAYGSNLALVDNSPNRWAFYSGDINQDLNIDLIDFPSLDFGINHGLFGYYASDLNGDGNVDLLDFPVLDANINAGVFSHHP